MKAIMKLLCICLALTGTAGSMWGRSKSSTESISVLSEHLAGSRNGFEVNLTDRFFELVQDPSYVQAVAELVELQKKSTCSRQATLDFMDLCKNHEKYAGYSAKASEQQMEILEESYAVSLAICELKKGGIAFPFECAQFETGSAGSGGTNPINQDQLQCCIKSLNKDGTHWTSFSNSLEKATVIRQAARVSVEKDQLIETFKKGAAVYDETIAVQVQTVMRFTSQLDLALANLVQGLKNGEAETQSFVHSLQNRFSNFMAQVMRDVSGLTANAKESLKSVVEGMDKALAAANFHVQRMEETGAQAREVQQSLVFGAQRGLETVLTIRDETVVLNSHFDTLITNMVLLQKRQDAIDQRTAEALMKLANLTEYLEAAVSLGGTHVETLEKAGQASMVLLNHIEVASKSMMSWSRRMFGPTGPFGISPAFLIGCPIMTVCLGSYGLEPSIYRNIALGGGGLVMAKFLSIANNWNWHSDSMSASNILPFLARGIQRSVEALPVETEPAYPSDTDQEDMEHEGLNSDTDTMKPATSG